MCNGPLQTGVGTRGGLSAKLPRIKTLKISLKKRKAETRFFFVLVEIAFCSKSSMQWRICDTFHSFETYCTERGDLEKFYFLQRRYWEGKHVAYAMKKVRVQLLFCAWRTCSKWPHSCCSDFGKSGICQEKYFLEQGWKSCDPKIFMLKWRFTQELLIFPLHLWCCLLLR